MTFRDTPFTWKTVFAPAGDYLAGFLVTDLDGNTSESYNRITVRQGSKTNWLFCVRHRRPGRLAGTDWGVKFSNLSGLKKPRARLSSWERPDEAR